MTVHYSGQDDYVVLSAGVEVSPNAHISYVGVLSATDTHLTFQDAVTLHQLLGQFINDVRLDGRDPLWDNEGRQGNTGITV